MKASIQNFSNKRPRVPAVAHQAPEKSTERGGNGKDRSTHGQAGQKMPPKIPTKTDKPANNH
jgi:hypothetical protein